MKEYIKNYGYCTLVSYISLFVLGATLANAKECGLFNNPCWSLADRPNSPSPGTFGYNTTLGLIEWWNGMQWLSTSTSIPGVLFGDISSSMPFPGGPLGSSRLIIQDGSINIWNNRLYGWGGSAAALCVQAGIGYPGNSGGQGGNCPISGSFGSNGFQPNGSGSASYTDRDTVGALVYNFARPPLFGNPIPGTFTSMAFVPKVPLNSTQIAELRVGMPIDTNDPTPYSGLITGWASGGESITVQGWFRHKCHGFGCIAGTPSGTAAKIGANTKIFGMNVVSTRNTTSEAIQNTAIEVDCNNGTGVDDKTNSDVGGESYDGCVDAINLGTNRASYAYLSRGKFVTQINVQGDSTEGVLVKPSGNNRIQYGFSAFGNAIGIGFSYQGGNEILRGWGTAGDIYLRVLPFATEMGQQDKGARNYVQRFYSSASGSGNADATWTYSGGSGSNNGTVSLSAGSISMTGSLIDVTSHAPSSSSESCTPGQRAWDKNYEYRCVAANTWKRAALSAF